MCSGNTSSHHNTPTNHAKDETDTTNNGGQVSLAVVIRYEDPYLYIIFLISFLMSLFVAVFGAGREGDIWFKLHWYPKLYFHIRGQKNGYFYWILIVWFQKVCSVQTTEGKVLFIIWGFVICPLWSIVLSRKIPVWVTFLKSFSFDKNFLNWLY